MAFGCTFIHGGVHTRTHVYWGWHPLQGVYLHNYNWGVASTSAASTTGGVPSLLGVCIPGHMCTGGGIHYRGCTFITITGGWHPPVLHPLQGVYLHCWGCSFIAGGVHTRMHVYWGWHPLQGVYLHCWGCAYQDACVLGVASTTGGVPS